MRTSDKTEKLDRALLYIHKGIGPRIITDEVNPHFKSRYATLAQVLDSIKGYANEHGVIIEQVPTGDMVLTRVTHVESSQFKEFEYRIQAKDPTNPQGIKSANTYAKRDSLESFFNVAESEDDDGNAASNTRSGGQVVDRKKGKSPTVAGILRDFEKAKTFAELGELGLNNKATIETLPPEDENFLRVQFKRIQDELSKKEFDTELKQNKDMETSTN